MNFLHECDLLRLSVSGKSDKPTYPGRKWYHGGAGELAVGDWILPPIASGAPAGGAPLGHVAGLLGQASVVYFSNLDRARFQALGRFGRRPLQDRGCVYEVEPDGAIWVDSAEDESWCAIRATVVRVVERSVSSWRGMSFSEVEDWGWKHGDFASKPSMEEAFSFTLRAHQLGLDNALRMQRRDRLREGLTAGG
jgi:hypothetical protein